MKECFECETTEDLQDHHVVPKSRGGTKTVILCYSCHMKAHGRDSKGLEHARLTKEGIAKAKSNGTPMGSHNPKVLAGRTNQTIDLHNRVKPHILEARAEGCETIRSYCNFLNDRRIFASRGGKWSTGSMHRVLKKIFMEDK